MMDTSSLIGGTDLDQIGIVVHDLHAVTQELTRLFGIGPFRIIEWPLEGIDPQSTYHGQPGNFRLLLAFATVGKTQLEIIQPLDGKNIFSEQGSLGRTWSTGTMAFWATILLAICLILYYM